jgi:hypothetical protein
MENDLPNVSPADYSPLDAALELWFQAREKLAPFDPYLSSNSTAAPLAKPSPEPSALAAEPPALTPQPSAPEPSPVPAPSAATPSSPAHPLQLLTDLRDLLTRFVILPPWAPEAIALWILHTHVFEQRDITTYLGVQSPVRRCGKTTLLTLLSRLVNRPIVAANVSSPAIFRAIKEFRPTLIIDEADTFLKPGDPLQGILNAGYTRNTAYILRVDPSNRSGSAAAEPPETFLPDSQLPADKPRSKSGPNSPSLAFFSCWCPKIIAQIGRLPETLADRCILIQMQRKTPGEKCDRLRELDTTSLRQQCARFAQDHAQAIAAARPDLPAELNDRAADIWEPLLVIADLAGGPWPQLARQASIGLSSGPADNSPISSLLLDICSLFSTSSLDRIPTRNLLDGLNRQPAGRPWMELRNGVHLTEMSLAHHLRPFGIAPKTIRIDQSLVKGYLFQDFIEAFQRYIPAAELQSLLPEFKKPELS